MGGMLNGHVIAGRVLGFVVLGGVISAAVSLFISYKCLEEKRDADCDDSAPISVVPTGFYDFGSVDVLEEEEVNDFPPDFRVIIHGGAGVVSKGIDSKPFFDALTRIMGQAYKYAKDGDRTATALDLAEYCVMLLEDDILFNAGRGSVFTAYETIEMEASIMDGKTLDCGAVSLIKTVKHPVSLARAVMELTKHNHLIGKAAEKLASKANLEVMEMSYFGTPKRREQLKRAKEMGDAVVNDHDYEDEGDDNGYSTDDNTPLRDSELDIPDLSTHEAITESLNSENLISEKAKLTILERMFLTEECSPDFDLTQDSIKSPTDTHDTHDFDSSEYDNKMKSKVHNVSGTLKYNDNHDKNQNEKTLEREREREKEKLLESYYPGSTGTVGCVCMFHGHVAAATSTGGLTNKMAGRVGDTSIIGAGTYANDRTCAVSATGKGEEFMRAVAAYDVAARMEIGGMRLRDAARDTVFKKLPSESGGIIAITPSGEYSMEFNSKGMFRAICDSNGKCSVGIWEEMIPFEVNPQGRPSIIVTGYSEKMEMTESVRERERETYDQSAVRAALEQQ